MYTNDLIDVNTLYFELKDKIEVLKTQIQAE